MAPGTTLREKGTPHARWPAQRPTTHWDEVKRGEPEQDRAAAGSSPCQTGVVVFMAVESEIFLNPNCLVWIKKMGKVAKQRSGN